MSGNVLRSRLNPGQGVFSRSPHAAMPGGDINPAPGSLPPPVFTVAQQFYGDLVEFGIAFSGAGGILALERPKNTRIQLLIQNRLTLNGELFYSFGKEADNGISSIGIPAGGNRLFDIFVPQNDLFLFASSAGSAIIEYSNLSITG